MNIGHYIRKYRKNRRLTQQQLAEKAGIGRTYLCDIETNRQNPSLLVLYSLANVLEVSVPQLFGAEGEENCTSPESHIQSDENYIEILRRLEGMSEKECKKALLLLRRVLVEAYGKDG